MNQVIIGNTTMSVPGKMDELSLDQIIKYCRLINNSIPINYLRAQMLQILLKKTPSWFLQFSESSVSDMLLLTDFVFEKTKDGSLQFKIPLFVDNKLPDFKVGFNKYYGPDRALTNTVFCEFIEAEKHYLRFIKTRNDQDLDKLIATIYRSPKEKKLQKAVDFDGDIRERYNPYSIEDRAHKITSLSSVKKQVIFLFYQGCREFIVNNPEFSFVFTKPAKSSSEKMDELSWVKVLIDISGQKFGDMEKTSYMNTYVVLMYLNNLLKNSQPVKKK